MTTTTPVLRLDQVRKTYPGSPPVESVRGVDLTVHPGELIAIVGPSGSGKTTLLNLAAGLDRPTSGSVRIAGHRVEDLSDRQLSGLRAHHLGVVFQRFFSSTTSARWATLPPGCCTAACLPPSGAARPPRRWTASA